MTVTYIYALLKLSKEAYEEIREKMLAAGHEHAFWPNPESPETPRISLQGIAVVPEEDEV